MRQVPLRLYVLAAITLVLLMLPSAVSAMDAQIRIYIDGELVESEHKTELIDHVPYVSEQFVKQQLGALTVWDSEHRTLALERGTYTAQLVLNESHAVAGGNAIRIEAPPIVLFGDIYLPATSIGDLLGVKVTWDIVNNALQFYLPQDNASNISGGTTPSQQPSPGDKNEVPSDNAIIDGNVGQEDSISNTPDEDVASASPNNPTGAASIGSIETSGDQIIIQADGILKADIFLLTDPNRLVIDIPNSKLGSQLNGLAPQLNGQVDSTHPHIQRIRYALFKNDPSTVRLVIDLDQPVQYSVVQQNDANKLVLDIRSKAFQVVLDAGHGGKDPGAITYSDKYEKDFTLPMTLKVYDLLLQEPFIKPVLTRADDTFVELDQRAKIANDIDADIFLSIHGNTYIPSVHGTETYYYDIASKSLAEIVHRHIVEESGFRDRNIRQEEYKVLRLAKMPAALIEVGYVSNKEQEALMYDEKFQDRIARAIVDAIKEYLQL